MTIIYRVYIYNYRRVRGIMGGCVDTAATPGSQQQLHCGWQVYSLLGEGELQHSVECSAGHGHLEGPHTVEGGRSQGIPQPSAKANPWRGLKIFGAEFVGHGMCQ